MSLSLHMKYYKDTKKPIWVFKEKDQSIDVWCIQFETKLFKGGMVVKWRIGFLYYWEKIVSTGKDD